MSQPANQPKPAPRKRKAKPKKTGRPRKEVDLKMFRALSAAGCSIDEIASMLRNSGCQIDRRTLLRRLEEPDYAEAREDGQNVGKARLRSNMVEHAKLKNSAGVHMSIFLAKNWLGMHDKSSMELSGRNGGPISTVDLSKATDEQLAAIEALFGPFAGSIDNDGGDQGGESQASVAAGGNVLLPANNR